MNREPVALERCQDDHLKQIASAIRPDDQPTVGIFAGVLDRECIVDSMSDVRLHDTVLARRVVDLHRLIVLRKGSAHAPIVIGSDPAPSRSSASPESGSTTTGNRECRARSIGEASPLDAVIEALLARAARCAPVEDPRLPTPQAMLESALLARVVVAALRSAVAYTREPHANAELDPARRLEAAVLETFAADARELAGDG